MAPTIRAVQTSIRWSTTPEAASAGVVPALEGGDDHGVDQALDVLDLDHASTA